MALFLSKPERLMTAAQKAAERGIMPTRMGSGELRELDADLWQRALFSARTTNAQYLSEIARRVERALEGGYNSDRGKLRLELQQIITRLGYTPEKGFPGDEALGIPPAEPGSLQDLSSDKRIDLILETQERLYRGAGQKARGNDKGMKHQFPAWELVRIFPRENPRGAAGSGTMGWDDRWIRAGGPKVVVESTIRLIALKDDPVWKALGDDGMFPDGLNVDHPPFAFNSGMGWRSVPRHEAQRIFGRELKSAPQRTSAEPAKAEPEPAPAPQPEPPPEPPAKPALPEPVFSTGRMDPKFKAALLEKLRSVKTGTLTDEGARELTRSVKASLTNALLTALSNMGTREGALKGWVTRRSRNRVRQAISDGGKAARWVIKNQQDQLEAMSKKGLGKLNFKLGRPGTKKPNANGATHSDGYGLSHILDKHGERALRQLPVTLGMGAVVGHEKKNKRYVYHKGWQAVLAKSKNGDSWDVITHFHPEEENQATKSQIPKKTGRWF